jgi:XTP/dITP diphosphohydrolase
MKWPPSVKLVLATRSQGKVTELREFFRASDIPVTDLAGAGVDEREEEEALEQFDSFEENAAAKARYFHSVLGTAVVAEDSGLEVEALGGRPGVRSKRWSGDEGLAGGALDAANNRKLLAELEGVANRSARYVCVAVYVDGDREIVSRGETEGWISTEPRGTGGFGYDPLFVSADLGASFGELSGEEKASVSHRTRAFRGLLAALGAS